jgi:hypothetical protein
VSLGLDKDLSAGLVRTAKKEQQIDPLIWPPSVRLERPSLWEDRA